MNQSIYSKVFLYLFGIFVCLFISYFVALRPEGLTADYDIYSIMYYFPERRSGELIFQFFRWIFFPFENGFILLLFAHCFISLFLKYCCLVKVNITNAILFVIFYFFCFFVLWEMTQIRISLAISLFMFGLICVQGKFRYIIFLISLLTHSSMIFLLIPFFLYTFLRENLKYVFILIIPLAFLCKYYIFLTGYSAYESSSYEASYSFFSLKNLMIVFIIYWCIFLNRSSSYVVKTLSVISISIIIFSIILGGTFPAVSIRITDIATFLMVTSLIFLRNTPLNFYFKIIILLIVCPFYYYLNFLSDKAIFNLDIFNAIFRNYF